MAFCLCGWILIFCFYFFCENHGWPKRKKEKPQKVCKMPIFFCWCSFSCLRKRGLEKFSFFPLPGIPIKTEQTAVNCKQVKNNFVIFLSVREEKKPAYPAAPFFPLSFSKTCTILTLMTLPAQHACFYFPQPSGKFVCFPLQFCGGFNTSLPFPSFPGWIKIVTKTRP